MKLCLLIAGSLITVAGTMWGIRLLRFAKALDSLSERSA